jgi:hypothetical protein
VWLQLTVAQQGAPKADGGLMAASDRMRALLASSLGLPGMQELLAMEPPQEGLAYRFTHYDEQALPQSQLLAGDPDRYRIDSHQLRWVQNIDQSYTLTVGYLHEALSGSSPWYVIPDSEGRSLQVMSGATIREKRDQLDVALGLTNAASRHEFGLGYSTEDDYEAVYGSYSGRRETADGQGEFSFGLSYSDDKVEPSDAAEYGRIERALRNAWSGSLGFSQVLNRNAVIQTGLSITRQSGFLSDPYKYVLVGQSLLPDQRPDERVLMAFTTRFRQYVEKTGGAVQLDYRYYQDSWDIRAHTLEAAFAQPLGEDWELTPGLRYHSQNGPDFYAPYFTVVPDHPFWSSDYRLATYGALSYKLNLQWQRGDYRLQAGAEYYDSDGSLALSGRPQDTPGLVDFWRLSLAFSVTL